MPKVDLTKIITAYGLLDEVYGPGTKDLLRHYPGPFEMYFEEGWTPCGPGNNPGWENASIIRAVALPPPPRVRWIGITPDERGREVLFVNRGSAEAKGWTVGVDLFLFREAPIQTT